MNRQNPSAFTPLEKVTDFSRCSLTGFTLVEVLISLMVLGLGILVLFNLFPLGWQSLAYSRRLSEVSFLAQKKLEELKAQNPLTTGQTSGKEGSLEWTVSVSPVELEGAREVNLVELNIEFDFQAKKQNQKFVTYLPKK